MASATEQRALTSCLNKLSDTNWEKLSSKYWEDCQSYDEEGWRAVADHVANLIFKPTTSHVGWSAPYFTVFGKFIAAIDTLCVERNGPKLSFAFLIIQACRRQIHALLTAGVPEGADAHDVSSRIKTGLMQGTQTLAILFSQGCCSLTDFVQVYKVILSMEGASFMEAERSSVTGEGDAVVHLMSGAALGSRPIPGEIVADLIRRIAQEVEVPASRIALLASGCQVGVHLCVDELANTPLTVVVWSPALTYDHRIEVTCAGMLIAAGWLRATEEGQAELLKMISYLEVEKSSHANAKRSQFLIEDFLKKMEE